MWFLWISHRLLGHLGVEDGMFLWNQWDFYHFENGNQWALFHEYAFPVMGNSWKFDLEKNEIGSFCGWESMWELRQESWWNQWTMARKTHWWHHWWRKATPLSPALVARVDFGPEKKNWGHWKVGVMFFYRVRPRSSIRFLKIGGKVWFDWPSRIGSKLSSSHLTGKWWVFKKIRQHEGQFRAKFVQ